VRNDDRPAPALEDALEGGEERADAEVVGDVAVTQWDVQVRADEDPLPRDVEVVERR
jgi:hypothetical protein